MVVFRFTLVPLSWRYLLCWLLSTIWVGHFHLLSTERTSTSPSAAMFRNRSARPYLSLHFSTVLVKYRQSLWPSKGIVFYISLQTHWVTSIAKRQTCMLLTCMFVFLLFLFVQRKPPSQIKSVSAFSCHDDYYNTYPVLSSLWERTEHWYAEMQSQRITLFMGKQPR